MASRSVRTRRRPSTRRRARRGSARTPQIAGLGRARDERRDLTDQRPPECHHVERERTIALVLRVPGIEAQRRLAVRAGAHDAPAPCARQRPARGPGGDRLPARIPARERRHRERRIAGQHRRERVDVAALPSIDVAIDDRPHRLVSQRAQRGLLALLGDALGDRRARALQGTVDRRDRRLQRLGDLGCGEAEHLALDQHSALGRGQVLESRDKRQLHALAALVAGMRSRESVLHAQDFVRVGLDPDRLDHRFARPGVGLGGRSVVDRQHPLGASRDLVKAGVGGDRVQPRAQRAANLELREPAPGPEQRVLQRVLGIVHRPKHAVAMGMQLAAVALQQRSERRLIAAARTLEQGPIRVCLACGSGGHSRAE